MSDRAEGGEGPASSDREGKRAGSGASSTRPTTDFWILCSAILLMFVGHQMVTPLVPLYSVFLGASPALIGLVISAAFLFPLFLAVPAGSLVDRYGSRGLLLTGMLLVGLSPFLVPLFPGFVALGALQVLSGLGQLLAVVAAQSFVAALGSGRAREHYFSWYSTFISVGQLIGPLLAGLLVDLIDFETAFAASGAIATLAVLLVVRLRQPDRRASIGGSPFPGPAQLRTLLANPGVRLALLVSGTTMIPLMGYQSFLPAFLDLLAFPATAIGAIISLRALVTILIRPFMPRLVVVLHGRLNSLAVTTAASAVGLAAIAYGDSVSILVLVAILVGVGVGIAQPLTMVGVADSVDIDQRGTAFGLRLTANRLMQVLGPLALGVIAQLFGYRAMFQIAGALTAVTVAILLLGRARLTGKVNDA